MWPPSRHSSAWAGLDPAITEPPSSYAAGRVFGCFFEDDFGISGLAGDPDLVRRTLARDLLMIGYCRAALGRHEDARHSFRASLETRLTPFSLAAAMTMSVPGVARNVSRLAPKIRHAAAAISV